MEEHLTKFFLALGDVFWWLFHGVRRAPSYDSSDVANVDLQPVPNPDVDKHVAFVPDDKHVAFPVYEYESIGVYSRGNYLIHQYTIKHEVKE